MNSSAAVGSGDRKAQGAAEARVLACDLDDEDDEYVAGGASCDNEWMEAALLSLSAA
jgi:hypothetical protein